MSTAAPAGLSNAPAARPAYWAHTPPDQAPIAEWVERFHRDGFLFLTNFLTPEIFSQLVAELDRAYLEQVGNGGEGPDRILRRCFEFSPANLRLFDLEPLVSFAEKLVAPDCHVLHNNSFQTRRGHGIAGWHQDDQPHLVVTDGKPPGNIRLPVLWFTANFYLTDVDNLDQGATQLIRGSHLLGTPCPPDPIKAGYADRLFNCIGPAGSVIMFNNQVWHRGALNTSDRVRKITQVTYGRRMINHMFYPFMNYVMPEHVYKNAGPRLKRLLGFLPSGAYG